MSRFILSVYLGINIDLKNLKINVLSKLIFNYSIFHVC